MRSAFIYTSSDKTETETEKTICETCQTEIKDRFPANKLIGFSREGVGTELIEFGGDEIIIVNEKVVEKPKEGVYYSGKRQPMIYIMGLNGGAVKAVMVNHLEFSVEPLKLDSYCSVDCAEEDHIQSEEESCENCGEKVGGKFLKDHNELVFGRGEVEYHPSRTGEAYKHDDRFFCSENCLKEFGVIEFMT